MADEQRNNLEPALAMPRPTRQSVDLRKRAKLRETDWIGTETENPRERAADNIDGTEEEERRRKYQAKVETFFAACPEKLRDALRRALSTPGRITKKALADDAGISRPTLDRWLELASTATWGTARPPFGRIAV